MDSLKSAPSSDHYKQFSIEPLVYIEENQLGFHEGNSIKYVSRWKFKNGLDDLKKAQFYMNRLIELHEKESTQ